MLSKALLQWIEDAEARRMVRFDAEAKSIPTETAAAPGRSHRAERGVSWARFFRALRLSLGRPTQIA